MSSHLLSYIQTVNNQEEVIWHGINEINLHWY